MNKKGFMFVETIVTITVLISLLVTLYAVFVNLLQKEKVRTEYDKYGDVMALFYYKEMNISELDSWNTSCSKETDFNLSQDSENNIVVIECGEELQESCNISISEEFKKYINQFKTCPNAASNKLAIFAEFKYDNAYTYAHLYYPNY